MENMDAKRIRSIFIDFFKSKEHRFVPSSPIVVKNDPSLMFANAGMNQFKNYFLGNESPAFVRAANSQKCLRVSGKHNDLEEVGVDTYHHTMFEMLGNWSFGDYFKKEAIAWAWELLTGVYKLPQDRLYVSVFTGDEKDGLGEDREAYDFWREHLDAEKIVFGSKKDNFWEMGETGPCGPCSEIHIDLRPDAERKEIAGKALVNADHPQVIEIWNLVFMQYNRLSDGSLTELPAKHVDTGMGFERLVRAIQNKSSNYDTDIFTPFIEALEDMSGKRYGVDEKTDIAIRVVVDHIRAITFTIVDGQLPSNNKAGYVIRRILRRAVRYGYTFLGFNQPFLFELVPLMAETFGEIFPEVAAQQAFAAKVIREEERAFLRTLEKGLAKLDQIRLDLEEQNQKVVPGMLAFELYDTYGFPLDLTSLIARENGMSVDERGFEAEMEKQKSRSRAAAEQERGDWVNFQGDQESVFVGYEQLESETHIIKYREIKEKKGNQYQLVLTRSPFYAESGGQVGDRGLLVSEFETIKVTDTRKENDLTVHVVDRLPEYPEAVFTAKVDAARRRAIMDNHSATHLLQAALKEVLGEHIQQKGSLVNEHLLRFDFSHFSKLTDEEIAKVEEIVNHRIRENIPLEEIRDLPLAQAKEMGATALFGEKYGDYVRVIAFDRDFSIELCGGTHVRDTGRIGLFKILSEGSVSAGVRRIEAVTGARALAYINGQLNLVREVQYLLKNPRDLKQSVEALVRERQELKKEIEGLYNQQALAIKKELLEGAENVNGTKLIISQVKVPTADSLKKLAYELKNETESLIAVLAADIQGKPQIAVIIDEAMAASKQLDAGKIVRELAQPIQGGGGGHAHFASAGGKKLEGLPQVVENARKFFSFL
ncbi:MAG TPA: alanine--tRNA ligase [Cyclobacteriaceae bacterium]|nr:alanine--tRNA ligase [Cyclobacteriaceae bacterium]